MTLRALKGSQKGEKERREENNSRDVQQKVYEKDTIKIMRRIFEFAIRSTSLKVANSVGCALRTIYCEEGLCSSFYSRSKESPLTFSAARTPLPTPIPVLTKQVLISGDFPLK